MYKYFTINISALYMHLVIPCQLFSLQNKLSTRMIQTLWKQKQPRKKNCELYTFFGLYNLAQPCTRSKKLFVGMLMTWSTSGGAGAALPTVPRSVAGDVGQEMEVNDLTGRYRHARRAPVDENTLQPMRRVSKAGLESTTAEP
jgi:hypothetical protein